MIRYNIIATGSKGNAVKIDDILIDCGVSFKKLKDVYKHRCVQAYKIGLTYTRTLGPLPPVNYTKVGGGTSNFEIWLLSLDGSQVDRMWSFTNTN